MGVRGRKPTLGSAEVERRVQDTGGTVVEMAPPEELSEVGRGAWETLLPDLIAMKVFRPADTLFLVELCETYAAAVSFRRESNALQTRIEEFDGEIARTEDPDRAEELEKRADRLSARLKRSRAGYLQHMKLAQSIAGEFGVSPVARMRLGLMKLHAGGLMEALNRSAAGAVDDEDPNDYV